MSEIEKIKEFYEITENGSDKLHALAEVLSNDERNLIPEKTNDSPAINIITSTPDGTDVLGDTIKHLKNES